MVKEYTTTGSIFTFLFLGTVIIGTIYTILDNFFGVSIDWLLTIGVIFLISFIVFSIVSFLFLRK